MRIDLGIGTAVLALSATLACSRGASTASSAQPAAQRDTAFAAMQSRGQMAMGVDQYTSTHTFDALPDGGRIELLRDVADTLGIRQIRALLARPTQTPESSTPK